MKTELILRIEVEEADIADLETDIRNFIQKENIGISLYQFDYLNKRWKENQTSKLLIPFFKLNKTEKETVRKDYKEQRGKDGVFDCGNKHTSINDFWKNHSNANDYPEMVYNHIYTKEYRNI